MGIVTMVGREAIHAAARSAQQAPRHPGTVATRPQTAPARRAPRPWIDGAVLLTNVCEWLKRYLYLDSEAKYWALTLWIAGTHFRDEDGHLVHDTYPIAGFLSSEPGSGKTHALELLSILCPNAPGILVEPSEAAVALLIAKHKRTILLDEGDILFGSGRRKAAIRAIINSGYKRGGTWDRVRKGDVDSVRTDGAKAIAALSVVKTGTGTALDALMTRIIEWEMHKPPPGTPLHKLREVFHRQAADRTAYAVTGREVGQCFATLLASWAAQERGALAAAIPETPEGVELREEEKWLPLIAVAGRAHANREQAALKRAQDSGRSEDAEERRGADWRALAWDACIDMSVYGGTPDTTGDEMDMVAEVVSGWSNDGGLSVFAEPPSPSVPVLPPAYRAGCAVTPPGAVEAFGVPFLTGTWATPEQAREAVQDAAGTPLAWQEVAEGVWGATVATEGGPVFDYAVSAIRSEERAS